MAVALHRPITLSAILLGAAPILIALGAALAVRSPLAIAHPLAAGLLFLWITSDTSLLVVIARAERRRPPVRKVIATLAVAALAALFVPPPAVRAALLSLPGLAAAIAVLVVVHFCWGLAAARRQWRAASQARWIAAASELLPPALVRLAAAELRLLHLALFRWGAAPDVPSGCQGFAYHRHLTPMAVTLLALQAIEVAVHHLLLAHWSAFAAYILFVLSDVGLVYMIGLIKSFRLRPVLLTPEGVRIRTGIAIDRFASYDSIAAVETAFDSTLVKDRGTLNAGLLAWPNLVLRLGTPIPRRPLLRPRPPITAIAFRLDDPEPFVRALRWRLENGQT